MTRFLPALILLIGCADADPAAAPQPVAMPTVATASGETATLEDETAPEATESSETATRFPYDWEGRYVFSEGSGVYTYDYELTLLETEGGYVGTFSRIGPQETRFYNVYTRATASGGIEVIVESFGDENVHPMPEIGQTLFELRWDDAGNLGDEAGDRVLMTYWGKLTKTGVEGGRADEKSVAFTPAVD